MNPPTLYEEALKLNTLRALLCLRVRAFRQAGAIASAELEVYQVYELVGADRESWVKPLINVCRGIMMLVDEGEDGGQDFNTLKVWPLVMRSFESFEAAHGDAI